MCWRSRPVLEHVELDVAIVGFCGNNPGDLLVVKRCGSDACRARLGQRAADVLERGVVDRNEIAEVGDQDFEKLHQLLVKVLLLVGLKTARILAAVSLAVAIALVSSNGFCRLHWTICGVNPK